LRAELVDDARQALAQLWSKDNLVARALRMPRVGERCTAIGIARQRGKRDYLLLLRHDPSPS
jgi:hypothetical protein